MFSSHTKACFQPLYQSSTPALPRLPFSFSQSVFTAAGAGYSVVLRRSPPCSASSNCGPFTRYRAIAVSFIVADYRHTARASHLYQGIRVVLHWHRGSHTVVQRGPLICTRFVADRRYPTAKERERERGRKGRRNGCNAAIECSTAQLGLSRRGRGKEGRKSWRVASGS
jgi:hypothetical protein